MTTPEEIYELIRRDEELTLDFKDSRILSDTTKLGKLMVALANTEGGKILIGVTDGHLLEGMKHEKGHAEHIMNIARDKCDPPIAPTFKSVKMNRGDVYIVEIPKMRELPHALKTKYGKTYYIRVGPTIREPSSQELKMLFSRKPVEEKRNTHPKKRITKVSIAKQDKEYRYRSRKRTVILNGKEAPYYEAKTAGEMGCVIFTQTYNHFFEDTYYLEAFLGWQSLSDFLKILTAYDSVFGETEKAAFSVNQVNYAWFGFGKDNFIYTLKSQKERYEEANKKTDLRTHHSEAACFVDELSDSLFYISAQPEMMNTSSRISHVAVGFIFEHLPFDIAKLIEFFKKIGYIPEYYSHINEDLTARFSLYEEKCRPKRIDYIIEKQELNKELIPWVNGFSCTNPYFKKIDAIPNPTYGSHDISIKRLLANYDKILVNLRDWHPMAEVKDYKINQLDATIVPSSGFSTLVVNYLAGW